MTRKKEAALLAQTRPPEQDPFIIISTLSDDVKLKQLISQAGLTRKEFMLFVRERFPLFDKVALCKCLNPQKYGVVLHPKAMELLKAGIRPQPEDASARKAPSVLSQCDLILRHFEIYGSITSLVAMRDYGIMRLASRITELRQRGYRIETVSERGKNRFGVETNYARYWLRKEGEHEQ